MADKPKADPKALPLKGSVLQLSEPRDGKRRVTFRELAAIYYVDDAHPLRDELLVALQRSLDSGEVLRLTYSLPDKVLTGFGAR